MLRSTLSSESVHCCHPLFDSINSISLVMKHIRYDLTAYEFAPKSTRTLCNLHAFPATPQTGPCQESSTRCHPVCREANRIRNIVLRPHTQLFPGSCQRLPLSDQTQPTVFDLVQRFCCDPLLLGQFPQVRGERIKVRLALTNKRANCGCGGSTALTWNAGDGVTHQFACKIRHAKQIILNWKRKILCESSREPRGGERRGQRVMMYGSRREMQHARHEGEKKKRTGEPDSSDKCSWTSFQEIREPCDK